MGTKGTRDDGGKVTDMEMDRILMQPDEIVPSSGFAASVMEAVRREATAPPPIPFPWKRALPFLVVAAGALVLMVVVGVEVVAQLARSSAGSGGDLAPREWLPGAMQGSLGPAVSWSALALLVAFISVRASMRLEDERA